MGEPLRAADAADGGDRRRHARVPSVTTAACARPGLSLHMGGSRRGKTSDISEERAVDGHVFDCARCCPDTKLVTFEKVTEPVAVDEVDRWGAVAGCFPLCIGGE